MFRVSLLRQTDPRFSGVAREAEMVTHLECRNAAGHVRCKR